MDRQLQARFPRSARYDRDWLIDGAFGANPLWLAEWLCEDTPLQPGMAVLDLGCGRAKTSIFLAREFDVNVWAVDLWIDPQENRQRIVDAGLSNRITPIQATARDLPLEPGSFDAILAFDSIQYFGTDALFLPYIVQFLKPKGMLGFASAGVVNDLRAPVPEHLRRFWSSDCWCLRSAAWWRDHWSRTGLVDVQFAETMQDGWRYWLDWAKTTNCFEWYLETIENDAGRNLAYVRALAKRSDDSPDLTYDLNTGRWNQPPDQL